MMARKNQSHCTTGTIPSLETSRQQKRRYSIRSAWLHYDSFIAKAKYPPPARNIGAVVSERGGMLQEITEESIVAEQIIRNNTFSTPACITRWMNSRLYVFSSYPHYHPNLSDPKYYLVGQ